MTIRADRIGSIAGEKNPHMHLVFLGLKPPEKPPHPVEFLITLENELFLGLCEIIKGDVSGDVVVLTEVQEILKFHMAFTPVTPWFNGTFVKGKGSIGDDEVKVDIDDPTKAPACLTCSYGAVK